MTETTATPAEYTHENTARASERFSDVMPATYDEKDDMGLLREKLSKRKKPIYAGLAFLCVVVIGVSVAVSTGGSTNANTASGYVEPTEAPATVTPAPSSADDAAATAGVHAADVSSSSGSSAGSAHGSNSGSVAGEASLEEGVLAASNDSSSHGSSSSQQTPSPTTIVTNPPSPVPSPDTTTSAPTSTPEPTTAAPTPAPTTGPILPYKALDFDWKNPSSWEYSDGSGVASGMISQDGIKLTPANSAQPIRSKSAWGGEKIVLIEWERSGSSDTNIWMLNTKIQSQFGANNGWPYWGEIDIFEMFTQDKLDKPNYDFSGFGGFGDVASYGQLTLHNGPAAPAQPCYCPASASKSAWYQNTAPMTSGCTAQFANTASNSIATIWGSDGNGQYLQLIQNPTITKGGVVNNVQTYDIGTGSGTVTPKIYNNKDLFWGTPSSSACASGGGHNPATGFPFFEDFRIILEEQKKNDGGAWFKVNNIQIFKKN